MNRNVLRALAGVVALAVAAGIGAKVQSLRARLADTPSVSRYADRQALFAASRTHAAAIVMLGDSLTEFGPWDELTGCALVVNRGINSDTSRGVANRLEAALDLRPKAVFLMIGINDISLGVPRDETVATIGQIVERIQQTGALAVVQYILPVASSYPRSHFNSAITSLNDGLRQRLTGQSGVELLDLRPAMSTPDGLLRDELTVDGVHLRAEGYKIWRDALDPYVRKACTG